VPIRTEHHYVPCVYLKNFADAGGKVFVYRLLVAHQNAREWQAVSPRGIGYHAHLYTRMVAGSASDEVEDWLGREFEAPAEEAIDRAIHDERLTPTHWRSLARFVAAQDVRTPARLMESIEEWPQTVPAILNEVLHEAVAKLQRAKQSGKAIETTRTPHSEYLPIRTHKRVVPGEPMGELPVETVAGRGFWLFTLKHLLTSTLNVLFEHRWTIVKPHGDTRWITSDDPVIRLNYNSPTDYNLHGAWGSKGTEILLPLGPKHLLYTQVGNRQPPQTGWMFPKEHTEMLQRIIAKHAHRLIFANAPSPLISTMRPRTVNPVALSAERQQWENWHDQQMKAERELRND
jgi:Protein of unknown function (DUF4238)